MQCRLTAMVPVTVAAACLALGMITGPIKVDAQPSANPSTAGAASSGGSWGTAREVPGVAAIDPAAGVARAWSVSCASPGNCAAGGNSGDQAFVVDETDGSWGTAQEVPGLAALSTGATAMVSSVSCGSAGNCAAGGYYEGSFGHEQAFVVDETDGSWGTAQEVPGTRALNTQGAEVLSVSCGSAGNCAAGGFYEGPFPLEQAFLVNETDGSWGTAQAVPGMAALGGKGSGVDSVSCSSAGNCAAAGRYEDSSANGKAFVVDETDGSWGAAQAVPGMAALTGEESGVNSVSCASAGNCAAAGSYAVSSVERQVFVVDETAGSWGAAREVPGLAALDTHGNADVYSVSCSSPGNCAAGGDYQESSGPRQAFVVDETAGSWGAAREVPGLAALDTHGNADVYSVSCSSPGNCAAGGDYEDSSGDSQAFVADETAGSWRTAREVPGTSALNVGPASLDNATVSSVSCSSPGNCAAVGYLEERSRQVAFVANETWATSTSLSLSPAGVTYGGERAGQVSVTVSSPAGTPPGTATVRSGATRVCTITLSAGTGTCAPPATLFPVGTVQLTATYGGSTDFASSTSAAKSLTVARAATQTGLALSAARVAYGDERAAQAMVTVSPQYGGTPTGTVTVNSGSTIICSVTLASAAGSCAIPATALPAGAAQLTATYNGDHRFAASASAATALTVAKAATQTGVALSAASAAYGNEQAEHVPVSVTSPNGTPHGTVTVLDGPAAVCSITLSSGKGTCTLPARRFPVGTVQLTATYGGSADFAPSASPATALTVVAGPTTTTLTLSAASVTYGNERAAQAMVTVSPQYGGTPTGTVTVNSGSTIICSVTLASAAGSCAIPATALPAGAAQLTATYNGDLDFARSVSAAKTLSVAKAASSTALSLSTTKVIYGGEQGERLSVTVTSMYGVTPAGTIAVMSGASTVCTITLASGKGSCFLAATTLPVGTPHLTAAYEGSVDVTASTSAVVSLSVTKAITRIALSLSASTVTYGREQGERLTVAVTPQYNGIPTGKVTIKAGAVTICTITLAAGRATCILTPGKVRPGIYALRAYYAGSSDFGGSASASKALTVVK